jgi:carbon storage regulator CsrA
MTTITRRVNQSIVINDEIRITVVHLRDQRVRLQVDAPANASIRRESSEDVVPESLASDLSEAT